MEKTAAAVRQEGASMALPAALFGLLIAVPGALATTEVAAAPHGRLLQSTTHVSSASELSAALSGSSATIVLAEGTYELNDASSDACNADSWFCVSRTVTIEAEVAGQVVLDAMGQRRVFQITGAGVRLIGLDITGGDPPGCCYSQQMNGGGLLVDGIATLEKCNIYGNTASIGGGLSISGSIPQPRPSATLIDCGIYDNGPSTYGGGINVEGYGEVTLANCTIQNNQATNYGGGVYLPEAAQADVMGCRISDNSGGPYGGGMYISGSATITNCVFERNSAGIFGPAMYTSGLNSATLGCSTVVGLVAPQFNPYSQDPAGSVTVQACDNGKYRTGCTVNDPGICVPCTTVAPGYGYSSHGGYADACPTVACPEPDVECATGSYRYGCNADFAGVCKLCTNHTSDEYYVGHGGSIDACPTAPCADLEPCAVGDYRRDCGGSSNGSCAACTAHAPDEYYVGNGGTTNSCPTAPCADLEHCNVGFYRHECGGRSTGFCLPCTLVEGEYFLSDGGLSDACSTGKCDDEAPCESGQYREGCGYFSPGFCVSCSNKTADQFFTAHGGRNDSCPTATCSSLACPAGHERLGRCGDDATRSNNAYTCEPCASGSVAASEGSNACTHCTEGKFMNASGETACFDCVAGSFCEDGAIAPFPCKEGTYSSALVLGSSVQCDDCPVGSYCSTGSLEPTACTPGTVQPEPAQSRCDECSPGTFMNASGKMACLECPAGSFCAAHAAAPLPCEAGSFSGVPGLGASEQCEECPAGSFCFAGAIAATDCSKGTYAKEARSQLCSTCPEGKFQGVLGQTACIVCEDGFTCDEGSVAPIPASCSPGEFLNATLAGMLEDPMEACTACPAGSWCAGGATPALLCSPGTAQSDSGKNLCDACGAGKYQGEGGATACALCLPGSFCEARSTTPIPCPAGTVGGDPGLASAANCEDVRAGFWAPTGSAQPEACPASGFYCPGRAEDEQNDPPGSKPILVEAGTARTTVNVTVDVAEVAFTIVAAGLPPAMQPLVDDIAARYDVQPAGVAVNRLPDGGLAVAITTERGAEADRVEAAVAATSPAELSALLNASVSSLSGPVMTNATALRQTEVLSECAAGYWCSQGNAQPCPRATYRPQGGSSIDMGDCMLCPDHSTTPVIPATGLADCLCDEGRFLTTAVGGSAICSPCPLPGTNCSERGVLLASLPLAPHYWRSGANSTDPRICPTYGNVGGEKRCVGGAQTCAGVLSGVFCTACPGDTYLDGSGACLECGSLSASSALVVVVVALLAAALLLALLCSVRAARALGRSSALSRVSTLSEASGLPAKAKQLISFYQMATSIQSAFVVTFPAEVRAVLSAFSFLSLNLFEFGLPIECMGLGSFLQRLVFMLLAPLCLLVFSLPMACWLLREEGVSYGPRAVLLRALPMALRILFVVFPLVSAVAVQAFDCEGFDDGTYWLRADFSLQCGTGEGMEEWTDEYARVRGAAAAAILLYPVGVPLLFLGLLLACRKQLSRLAPSSQLSASLGFLCAEYRKRWFVWEVLESARKLFFVSLVRLVSPGTLLQLLVALVVAQTLLVFQLSAAPYKLGTDNFLGLLSGISYTLLLIGAIAIKNGTLTEALDDQLSLQLENILGVPVTPVLVVLLGSTLASIGFAAAVTAREAARDLRQPNLRYADSGALVALPLPQGKTHHLFISHVWGSAQDQARVLRGRLQAVVPGLRVWLDVEDLEDISALEEAVDACQAVLIIVSLGYFQSKNCMRELLCCVSSGKPLVVVAERDVAHGGLTEVEARQQCLASAASFGKWGFEEATCPSASALADALLGPPGATALDTVKARRHSHAAPPSADAPIVYERVGAFQQAMLRLIVQQLVPMREIYLPGELGTGRKPALPPPKGRFHVWCSPHNHGARALLSELESACGWQGKLLVTEDAAQMDEADQLLLLLDRATWADGGRKDALAAEVRVPLEASPRRGLLLVHETDATRGGVDAFGHFFGKGQTPHKLLQLKIYAEIAVPMKPAPYRGASLAMLTGVFAEGAQQKGRVGRLLASVGLGGWVRMRPMAPASTLVQISGRLQEFRLTRRSRDDRAERTEKSLAEGSGRSGTPGGKSGRKSRASLAEGSGTSSQGRRSSNPFKSRASTRRSSTPSPGAGAAGPSQPANLWLAAESPDGGPAI